MIDVSEWGKFDITKLFDMSLPKGDLQVKKVEDGDIPLITPSNSNNGMLQRISEHSPSTLYDKGSLTVDMFGNAYYQEEDFFVTAHGHVNVLLPKMPLNIYTGTFLTSTIRTMFFDKYGFNEMCTQKVLKAESIWLPATSDGQPDWDYMESYMKAVMEESEKSLENLKRADDTKHLIDVSGWGEFRVGDLFDVSRPIARSSQKYKKGDMAFVASGCFNNGVTDYLEPKDENDYDEGNCLTVSPVDGYTFYQKDRFLGRGGAGSSIIILRNDMLNELRGKYLSTVIRFACKAWDYANMGNKDKLADTMVSLPIDANGEPDWQYMENYMRSIMDKSEKTIEDLRKAV